MAATYLHGVETIESEVGGQTIQIVKSAVIALFGIAPQGPVNTLTLCYDATDDAQFGEAVPGFNIPKTLEIFRAIAGSCPVMVVNTFNPATNLTPVTDELDQVTNGGFVLASSPIGPVVIKNADGSPATIQLGVDYNIDAYGNFTALTPNVINGTTYTLSYSSLNPTSVTVNQLVGGIDGNGNRTGIALYDLAYNTFGYRPKIFISPTYSSLSGIVAAMATAAAKQRAIYLVDAPYGTTVAGAIAGRGIYGDIVFNTADPRACLLYPYLQSYDDATEGDTPYPYSAYLAGVIAITDLNLGYWYSPSNKPIANATGIERMIEWSINDPGCDANQLNAAGIITIAAGYGTGFLAWGNRNASFPTSTSVKNFISLRRTDDMVAESMELAALPFIDQPITQGLIDAMREAGNALIRSLIQRGAVLPGSKVLYNTSDNPASQLATGQIVFERQYMIPTPAERVTFDDILNVSLLGQLN